MQRMISRSIILLLLLSILLCVSCACGTDVKNIVFQNAVHQSETISTAQHTGDPLQFTVASSSVSSRLLIDRNTFNIGFADNFSNKVWSALPQENNALAAAVSAVLVSAEGRYYLNSQDNAVAFGTAKAKNTSDGVQITYTMALSKEIAKKSEEDLTAGEAYLRLTLLLAVDDSRMTAQIDCSDLFVAEGFILERLSVLPYFGAIIYDNSSQLPDEPVENNLSAETDPVSEASAENETEEEIVVSAVGNETPEDYLVVPDGSGALIRTNSSASGLNLSFPAHTGDGVNSPYVPAAVFGVKNGTDAFVCAVTQGDAVASVRALNLTDGSNTYYIAYPEFLITETKSADGFLYCGTSFSGTLQLVYKFLSGNAADYISMAIAAGEELIRAGILPQSQISDTVIPLNIGLVCSANGSKNTVQTSYAQAEDLLSVLKAKGIDRANILLQGAFSGGLAGKTLSSLKSLRALGGEQTLKALCTYAQRQGFQLFAGVNMLSAEKKDAA